MIVVQMGLRERIAALFRNIAEQPEAKTAVQAAQFASTLLFVVLYIWSTYSPPALWSARYNLDLMLCCMFAVDYVSRFMVIRLLQDNHITTSFFNSLVLPVFLTLSRMINIE